MLSNSRLVVQLLTKICKNFIKLSIYCQSFVELFIFHRIFIKLFRIALEILSKSCQNFLRTVVESLSFCRMVEILSNYGIIVEGHIHRWIDRTSIAYKTVETWSHLNLREYCVYLCVCISVYVYTFLGISLFIIANWISKICS